MILNWERELLSTGGVPWAVIFANNKPVYDLHSTLTKITSSSHFRCLILQKLLSIVASVTIKYK